MKTLFSTGAALYDFKILLLCMLVGAVLLVGLFNRPTAIAFVAYFLFLLVAPPLIAKLTSVRQRDVAGKSPKGM